MGPQGPAGGPLVDVLDADGNSLGPSYGLITGQVMLVATVGTSEYWVSRSVRTGTIVPNIDLYFVAADCTTGGGDGWIKDDGTLAAEGFVFRNFDKVVFASIQDTTRSFGSVRRGATGACETISESFAGIGALAVNIPLTVPAPLELVRAQ